MTAPQVFDVLCIVCFALSCIIYRKLRDRAWGDRLLCLAYGFLFSGFAALFKSWGVL